MDDEELIIAEQIFNDLEEAELEVVDLGRVTYNRIDAFTLPDNQFIKLFRLSKDLVRRVIDIVTPFLPEPSRKSALKIETKVLVALFFFGHGSYQENVGKSIFAAICQPTVSRVVNEITNILNREEIINQFVKFPENIEELRRIRNRFINDYNFLGVVGVIDCTHIALVRPKEDEHIYVNRKNYHSLNVQLICDSTLKILNVNARYPGSCHDAYVWRNSAVSHVMEQVYRRGHNQFFLLGDSGYPLRPWLITPFLHPEPNSPEERFNNRQKSVRNIIERCNGLLKNRFRCLLKHRVLHYSPTVAGKIVNACVLLHNMCIDNNIPEPELDDMDADFGIYLPDRNENNIEQWQRVNEDLNAGRLIRQNIVDQYFRN